MIQGNSTKDEYIKRLSARSDSSGNKLIEFLNKYNLNGLIEATEDQLKEFYEEVKKDNAYCKTYYLSSCIRVHK